MLSSQISIAGSCETLSNRVSKRSKPYWRNIVFWTYMKLSWTFELEVAKWLCQNRVIFSSNCRLVLNIRVNHQRRSSLLFNLSLFKGSEKSKLADNIASIAELSICPK